MNRIFNHSDYKSFLREVLHSETSPRGFQSKMAKHLGCQSAYLYQVLKGSNHLTEDQAYKVTTFLSMSDNECNCFLLLVRLAKAASPELRAFISEQLKSLLKAEENLANKSGANVVTDGEQAWDYYFSSTLPSAIHLLTSSPFFQTAEAISKKLSIDLETTTRHLDFLNKFGFVERSGMRWIHKSPSYHFSIESKYNLTLQIMRRTQAISSLLKEPGLKQTHFSSLFTLDSKSLEKLKLLVSRFVEESQTIVHEGGTDDLHVLSLDLFRPF